MKEKEVHEKRMYADRVDEKKSASIDNPRDFHPGKVGVKENGTSSKKEEVKTEDEKIEDDKMRELKEQVRRT